MTAPLVVDPDRLTSLAWRSVAAVLVLVVVLASVAGASGYALGRAHGYAEAVETDPWE